MPETDDERRHREYLDAAKRLAITPRQAKRLRGRPDPLGAFIAAAQARYHDLFTRLRAEGD